MKPTSAFYKKIDDIEIYFEIYAKGEAAERFSKNFSDGAFLEREDNVIVMLHGNGEDHTVFSGQFEALCEKNCIIAIDSRGHGKTSRGNSEYTIDLMAEDISKLMDELNVGNFKLIGFSDGGNIALTYAVRHPERLSALAVAGANINPTGIKASFAIPMRIKYFFAKMSRNKNEECNHRYQLLSLMVNYPHIAPRMLGNVVCKSLVIEGEHDVIKRSHTKLIFDSLKNSRYICIEKSGHNVFGDATEKVNTVLKEFIEE